MYHDHSGLWVDFLRKGLQEDGWPWDWTSLGLDKKTVQASILAKSDGIWAADGLVAALQDLSKSIQVRSQIKDGKSFQKGDVLLQWKGPSQEILAFERPFLNLAAYVSGIATVTSRLVKKVQESEACCPPRVALTRKTLPGYRDLAILGVLIGGGYSHRVSLAGGILIKENHITIAGGIEKAIQHARSVAPHGLRIEVEVRTLKEFQQALKAQVEAVLLDNFEPNQVVQALQLASQNEYCPLIEVSGGLTEENLLDYAIEGVDILSIGSLTHSVKSVDLSLLIQKTKKSK